MRGRRQDAVIDPDAAVLRRASRSVGLQITLAFSVLVLLVVVVAFTFVLAHLKPDQLLRVGRHESTIDVGGIDILVAAVGIGLAAIVLAGLLSWFATRRAVRPLGEALRSQRDFVANASHELRTPLAVLDARLQYLQRRLRGGEASEESIPSADAGATIIQLRHDARTLVQIVNELLLTAEDEVTPPASTPLELRSVLGLAVDSMSLLAAEKDVTITLDAPRSVNVLARGSAIDRCLIALLDNALRFSPTGSTITVSMRSERGFAEIRVTDEGPGIIGLEPSRVFERFSRGDNNAAGSGSGIGLSLVKDTVEQMGGSAAVESTGADGTVMLLRLPRSRRRAVAA